MKPDEAIPTIRTGARLGVTVTRKIAKAAGRNRLRRATREFFRLRRDRIRPDLDIVVNPRREALDQPAPALWRDLEAIFRRAGAWGGAQGGDR